MIDQTRTYNLALEVIFLDKLGEGIDTHLIQSAGARLMLGQANRGGWSYACPPLDGDEKQRLKTRLSGAVMKGTKGLPQVGSGLDNRPPLDPIISEMLTKGTHVGTTDPPIPGGFAIQTEDDNSNTQFALIAHWSARRNNLPVNQALQRVEIRFRSTQVNGGWRYHPMSTLAPTPAMTYAGMLGLAVASGLKGERVLKSRGTIVDGKFKPAPE